MAISSRRSETNESDSEPETVDLPDRTQRALEQYITITPDIGRARGADNLVLATSESGSSYLVDLQSNTCECPDSEHRDPTLGCKHIRRARFALGRWPIPEEVATEYDIDPTLGEHTDAEIEITPASGVVAGTPGME